MSRRRPAAFAAAIALLAGGLIGGIAAPASADTLVATYAELVTAVAAASDTVQLSADITQNPSTLAVDAADSVTIDIHGFDLRLTAHDDNPGIGVPATSTLTLIDTVGGGKVDVAALDPMFTGAAGIGTATGNAGTIVIDGAVVQATGLVLGAGIGGGSNGSATVQVLSGEVIATGGGTGGAGIGGGAGAGGSSVTISGGSVDAIAFNEGAGIGGGEGGDGGTILITAGTVKAQNITTGVHDSGAGIGGGAGGAGGTITISGGTVTATGGSRGGAGIGGGAGAFAGTLNLLGGTISASATDQDSAAIGTGGLYLGVPTPVATVAGLPFPGSATQGGEGVSSRGATYIPDSTPGITYTAVSANANVVDPANSTLTFAYAVTFDADGGTPEPDEQGVASGALSSEPTAPTRAGSLFNGWHVDTAGGPLWDFTDPVTEPLHLVAAWLEIPVISGSPTNATAGTFYNFAMTVTPPGTTVSLLSGSLPNGLTVSSAGVISGVPSGPVGVSSFTLRASSSAGTDDIATQIEVVPGALQDIIIDTNGGSPGPHPIQVAYGETVPAQIAERPGYVLIDWHVGTTVGPVWDFDDPVTGPMTLIAAWGQVPVIDGPATASGTDGVVFTPWSPTQLDGTAVLISANGTLPSGLTVDSGTGTIAGTPTAPAGVYSVVLTATNSYGSDTVNISITIAHGVATSFTAVPSDATPDQGDTITITVTASDAFGNSWDASGDATITSSVASDVIVGNQVTFPHASPHTLTVTLAQLPAQQLVIQVAAAIVLGLTGSDLVQTALPIGLIAILSGLCLIVLWRRRTA